VNNLLQLKTKMYTLKAVSESDAAFLYLGKRFSIIGQIAQFWETKNDAFLVRYEVPF